MKPLFRWIVGGASNQGLWIMKESLVRTMSALGPRNFDWMVCYNNMDVDRLRFIRHISKNITLYEQSFSDFPLPESAVCHLGQTKLDGPYRGTAWKLCPARLRPDAHEIIMDNDIVIFQQFQALSSFLSTDDHTMLLRERFQNLGIYTHCFEATETYNSGFIGLPPGYDFGKDLLLSWERVNRYPILSPADEQGLVTFVLKGTKHFIVDEDTIIHLHHDGRRYASKGIHGTERYRYAGTEFGLHFSEANRTRHEMWTNYRFRTSVWRHYDEDHT